ncbi:nuclear transport factor 2 family protein [Ideonella azotifigens]|uniref:nuclear transport factor 2 family protein n=1 Tax=Ideonella azotifigens TaxID=513160 RepID=UPI0014775FE4|nr:nuclear transport factor 2 family protein [Ideonella azotifigens]
MTSVLAASRKRAEALETRDGSLLRTLLAEELRYTHATGITHDREGYLAFVRDRQQFRRVSLAVACTFEDMDTVVVRGQLSQTIQRHGESQRIDVQSLATEIWVRRDGWRFAVFQSTRLPG